jgi:hypothetical protein
MASGMTFAGNHNIPRNGASREGQSMGKLALGMMAVLMAMGSPGLARTARERGEHREYLRHVEELVRLLPGHPSMRYSLARARAASGDPSGAVAQLSELAGLGFGYDAAADPSFAPLASSPDFQRVVRRLADNRAPVGDLKQGSGLGLAGQDTEGVASAGASGPLFIGSESGNIYRHDPNNNAPAALIAKSPWTVLGVRPEPDGRHLLACTGDEPSGLSLLLRFRLDDGLLVDMVPIPASAPLCNDIALLPDGMHAVTDSKNGNVYLGTDGRLRPLPLGQTLFYPNGIAADPAGRRLYIAHGSGILAYDLASDTARPLVSEGTLIGAVDGMVWRDGSLIALQNLSVPARLLRITPDSSGSSAKVEVIASGHQALADGTTVAILGDEAFILTRTSPGLDRPGEPALFRIRI